jgi:arginine:pyruvate transaminase
LLTTPDSRRAQPPLSLRARRLSEGNQAGAWHIANEALERVAAGEQLFVLTLGDPVCPPHPKILEATTAALAAGRTHYTPMLGEMSLRTAIAASEGADIANIAVVPGAQHAAQAVMMLTAGEGDEVLISDPHYATYPGVVVSSGATPVRVPARPDLSVDIEGLAAAITPRTRAIFLNSPANPAGTALSAADYARLGELAEAHDLWLVVDEVYGRFRFDGAHVGAWQHGPKGRTVVLNSLSKSHAMTGYRVGWVIAPEPLVIAFMDWNAAALFGVSQFVQDAACAALALPAAELAQYRGGFARRARQVVERINAIPGLAARMPDGGMFVMMDCRGIDADDIAFAHRLLDEAGVAVVPGSGFGAGGRGHVRISLTPDADTLDAAFDRIATLLR